MSEIEEIYVIHVNSTVEGTLGSRVWMVIWNHNGSLFASCGDDKTVRIWKKITNPPYLECAPSIDDSHSRAVRCVEFSYCGRHLASAGFDSCVVIYSREDEVKCCAFPPTDDFLATCSRDKSVWFWQMDEDKDLQVSSLLQPHTQDVKFVAWHPSEETASTDAPMEVVIKAEPVVNTSSPGTLNDKDYKVELSVWDAP
ncbi:WD domain G-beta repeat protein [Trichostrongylus colubriformis]|uniref:WD domain G-beta repeat protein n=1 Tax=Trichostrongylus colubriformis TaxID=6319 RepID=A0AAN8IHN4_TRICO